MSVDSAVQNQPNVRAALRIPAHIGVIMDGNGRWANARGKPRSQGHVEGVKAVRRMVELCIRYGVNYLTIYSFSTENWTRPLQEVRFIIGLLHRFVASDLETLHRNNVRITMIGARDELEGPLQQLMANVEAKTAGNTGLNLVVAFNYGSKAEITEATRRIAKAVAAGELRPEDIDETTVERALYTSGMPDPDIILRTSGEQRISNFMLWQGAYSELVFVEENWPDFDESTFLRVLEEYSQRERRFGGIEAQD